MKEIGVAPPELRTNGRIACEVRKEVLIQVSTTYEARSRHSRHAIVHIAKVWANRILSPPIIFILGICPAQRFTISSSFVDRWDALSNTPLAKQRTKARMRQVTLKCGPLTEQFTHTINFLLLPHYVARRWKVWSSIIEKQLMSPPFPLADDLRRNQAHDVCGVERRKVSNIDSKTLRNYFTRQLPESVRIGWLWMNRRDSHRVSPRSGDCIYVALAYSPRHFDWIISMLVSPERTQAELLR